MLDDRGHRAGARLAHDAPVAGGVGDLGGQDGHGIAVRRMRVTEQPEGLAGQQRGVTADDDHGAVEGDTAVAQLVQGRTDRVAGALLLVLHRGVRGGVDLGEMRLHLLTGMADDHDEMLGIQLSGGGDDMSDEGAATEGVQDLRGRRLHAGALTRCENDDGCRAVGAHGDALRLLGYFGWWSPEGYRCV